MAPLVLAYYCSGHGYGHATRVSAFTRHLLSQSQDDRTTTVYIVSSAPAHVFEDSISRGAKYRYAEIDPVIVQPLPYLISRPSSLHALTTFLSPHHFQKLLATETTWLRSINPQAVLTDAAFLACLAAQEVGVPSVLVTNFTFDSVFSFLASEVRDAGGIGAGSRSLDDDCYRGSGQLHSHSTLKKVSVGEEEDTPIPISTLQPLTSQLTKGYALASLLVLLPGAIPIPAFPFRVGSDFINSPTLPSATWVDPHTRRMVPAVEEWMRRVGSGTQGVADCILDLHEEGEDDTPLKAGSRRKRQIIHAPLIVRPPSSSSQTNLKHPTHDTNINPYTPSGRQSLLTSLGVPLHVQEKEALKVLVVSFGGQAFRCPVSGGGNKEVGERSPRHVHCYHRHEHENQVNQNRAYIHGILNGKPNSTRKCVPDEERPCKPQRETGDQYQNQNVTDSPTTTKPNIHPTTKETDLVFKSLTNNLTTKCGSHGCAPFPRPSLMGIDARDDIRGRSLSISTSLARDRDTHTFTYSSPSSPSSPFSPSSPSSCESSTGTMSSSVASTSTSTSTRTTPSPPSSPTLSEKRLPPPMVPTMTTTRQSLIQTRLMLPDVSWIAVVCGVSKARRGRGANRGVGRDLGEEEDEAGEDEDNGDLPEGFYIAPRDVYMPDLMAVADVVLGKLGYGTVSECVDACTPFVYVSRPLFIEEHGLRMLLDQEGVGVELSREKYESGEWAGAVEEAWIKGREAKEAKRRGMQMSCTVGEGTDGVDRRQEEGRELAGRVVRWIRDWWEEEV